MMESIRANITGSFLMSLGAILYMQAVSLEPRTEPLAGSFVRCVCNFLVAIFLFRSMSPGTAYKQVLGKNKMALLVWGLFGTITITSYFTAMNFLGAGPAGFLLSTSACWLLLFNALAEQKWPSLLLVSAAILCVVGSWFIALPDTSQLIQAGLGCGILSGLGAAAAYWLIGGKIRNESTFSIMIYWSVVNFVVQLAMGGLQTLLLSADPKYWVTLLGSGLLAALGQYFVSASYQVPSNEYIGVISYCNCILTMGMELVFFKRGFSSWQYLGAAIISLAGSIAIMLQYSDSRRKAIEKVAQQRQKINLEELGSPRMF